MVPKKNDSDFHRKMAAMCFNETWDLLEKKRRTIDDDVTMLNLAHASLFHWSKVGTPQNRAVGAWQVSRVYAALTQPQMALWFAKNSMTVCRRNRLTQIMHTASEAVARAYAVGGETEKAKRYLRMARGQLGMLKLDENDRKIYLDQIRDTELLIRGAEMGVAKQVPRSETERN